MAEPEPIPTEDILELHRYRMVDEVTKSVESSLIRRYTVLGIVVAFLTGSGATLLVNNTLANTSQKLAVAEAIQSRVTEQLDAVDKVLADAKTLTEQVRLLNQREEELAKKFASLDEFANSYRTKLSLASQTSLTATDALAREVRELSDILSQIAGDNTSVADSVSSVTASLTRNENFLETAIKEARLEQFPVVIASDIFRPQAEIQLQQLGFAVEVYAAEGSDDDPSESSKAIWLGKDVPTSVAIPVIEAAVSNFPFLEFVSISGDFGSDPPQYVHSQIFIGGATDTAEDEKLIAIDVDAFKDLLAPTDSITEFHSRVRAFYGD